MVDLVDDMTIIYFSKSNEKVLTAVLFEKSDFFLIGKRKKCYCDYTGDF